MSNKASIVIGLGFGDEGKGLTTDYLCSQSLYPLVIRFNGGQQAGHTVCNANGLRHVFSSFGAGTLRGAATYWSSGCTMSPSALLNEYRALNSSGISPRLYLDQLCAVTTHYDVLYNRLLEQQRGSARHGSCGMGFGNTLQRHEAEVSLVAGDLIYPERCIDKLKQIRLYYALKAKTELTIDFTALHHDAEDQRFMTYLAELQMLLNHNIFITSEKAIFADRQFDQYIFEGAQGVLLDMDFGYFPHVTRSHTTSKNALDLIRRNTLQTSSVTLYGVSRVYHTRHGQGPFVAHADQLVLKNNEMETNVLNDFQGNFRTGPLDLDQLNYALESESSQNNGIAKHLVLTCADQVDEDYLPYTLTGKLHTGALKDIPAFLNTSFKEIMISRSPYAENLQTAGFKTAI